MRFTSDNLIDFAKSIEAKPSKRLLSFKNPKTEKGESFGWLTAILHLAPYKTAGFNTCAAATKGCAAACLNTAGMGAGMAFVHAGRISKTKWFKQDRAAFMLQLEREITALVKRAAKLGLNPAVRLNGTSDIPWENIRAEFANGFTGTIFDRFPDVQFYDYTKLPLRFSKPLPKNYDLTFSLADGNDRAAEHVLKHGGRVAVVFRNRLKPRSQARRWNLPGEWNGVKVIDADKNDLRFLDPSGVYCGLKAKGLATTDTTGFVHDIDPA